MPVEPQADARHPPKPHARRVLMVTRRFWPLVGGAEKIMASLASAFREEGCQVTLLTARWQTDWPAEIVHAGVPVVRLPNPAMRGWGTLRYMIALARWLRQNAHRFDLVYVSMLKHDAYTALVSQTWARWPVVLRCEGTGASGDCAWQRQANFGRRIARRCHAADAIVAPSPQARVELLAAGYDPRRIHVIPNGVPLVGATTDESRREARATLAEADPQLVLSENALLAVYTGRLHEGKGLSDLVAAWRLVQERIGGARLWIVGEGPYEGQLATEIEAARLTHCIRLPGAFDDVDEVLRAADLFVLPSHEEGVSLALLEAMARGVPAVASDIPGNRLVLGERNCGLLVPVRDPAALAQAIISLLSAPPRAASLAAAGRDEVSRRFSLATMVRHHLELFDALPRRT